MRSHPISPRPLHACPLQVSAIESEAAQSGASPAVDNPYLAKVGEGGAFYTHVEAMLRRYFELFGEDGDDESPAKSAG